MPKFAWLSSLILTLLMSFSLILSTPTTSIAIEEVTPTPLAQPSDEFNADTLLDEGFIQLQNGDYIGAIGLMDTLIDRNPNIAFAYIIRAIANTQLDLAEDAVDDFTQAIELEPWQYDYYFFRGDTHITLLEFDAAIVDFSQAIRINPLNPDAFLRRSAVYYEIGNDDAGDADDLIARAFGELETGESETAFSFLDEAVAIGNETNLDSLANAYYLRAIINNQNGENDAAIADYQNVLDADPEFHIAYLARGILYRQAGDNEKAADDFFNRIVIHGDETVANSMEIGETINVEMAYRRVIAIEFEGTAGQSITLSADDEIDTAVDPLIVLLDTDDEPIAGDDDLGGGLNSRIESFELAEDGTYTLLVSHAEGGFASGFNGRVIVTIVED